MNKKIVEIMSIHTFHLSILDDIKGASNAAPSSDDNDEVYLDFNCVM
jgi:uncharacterized protein (DUF362 family)